MSLYMSGLRLSSVKDYGMDFGGEVSEGKEIVENPSAVIEASLISHGSGVRLEMHRRRRRL